MKGIALASLLSLALSASACAAGPANPTQLPAPRLAAEDMARLEQAARRAEAAAKRAELAAEKAEVIFHKSLQK